jgi:hypothetical protein
MVNDIVKDMSYGDDWLSFAPEDSITPYIPAGFPRPGQQNFMTSKSNTYTMFANAKDFKISRDHKNDLLLLKTNR